MNKNIEEIKTIYHNLVEQAKKELRGVQLLIFRVGSLRLLLFIAGVAGVCYFWSEEWNILVGIIFISLLPFLLLIKYHNKLFYRKEYLEKKIEINNQELAALDYDTSGFDNGEEYIDPAHSYTYDLDIFGPHSLFQYINRTSTQLGKKCLSGWLNKHLQEKEDILKRQEAVRELASDLKFRQRFRILGLLHKGQAADEAELKAWAESSTVFKAKKMLRMLPALVAAANIICIVLTVSGLLPVSIYGLVWTCFVVVSFSFTSKVTKIQTIYGKKLQILATYAVLIQLIEERSMQSVLLKEIKEQIGGDKQKASHSIGQLSKLMNELDQRNNVFMYIILNGLFFWELRQIMRIEAWKERYAVNLPCWLAAIGHIDALCSLGTFAYNHPDYVYPNLFDGDNKLTDFRFCAKEMGHPLMHRDRCVRNDIRIEKRPFFVVITGANMAGKSTYLRTVGVNHLLACIGAPVCAREMELLPAQLITSLRTTDSLNDHESYFFAELKRLKSIIDKLQVGETLFIILDEILKGTNSTDKQKGSLALIKQLMSLRANGIIATHDLLLGALADSFPDEILNNCFEADIKDNELIFSYRLRAGIAQNMNACFLMKKMGIAVTD